MRNLKPRLRTRSNPLSALRSAVPKNTRKTLYLIDAHAYLHRAYHALPPLTTKNGEPVGALFGFARMLQSLRKSKRPDYIAVCFDTPEKTFRHEKFEDYKATRVEIDADLIAQLEIAEELTQALGLPTVAAPGFEADDLLATLARRGVREGMSVVLVTGDKDALQLVDGDIQVWNEARQKLFDADAVFEKFGVRPDQIVDYLTIVGDSSDNVPGVPGIGAKGAAKLLAEFGTLEKLVKAAHKGHAGLKPKAALSLVENEKQTLASRELIVLHEEVPISLLPTECVVEMRDPAAAEKILTRLEFHSLRRELLGQETESAEAGGGGARPFRPRSPPTRSALPFRSRNPIRKRFWRPRSKPSA